MKVTSQFIDGRAHREWRRVRAAFDVPLVRNAYSLVGSTLATAVLGLAFWVVAAHAYTTAAVGTNAAIVSTMMLLSSVAQLNLANGFTRFVPTARRKTRRFVLIGYGLSIAVGAVAAVLFLAGVDVWAPSLAFLRSNPAEALCFVVATMLWSVFALEDGVLTGLGAAPWILLENSAYGVLKLVMVIAVAAALPTFGVFAAWSLPLILLIIPVNRLLFGRLIPKQQGDPLEEIDVRSVTSYVAFDFVASLLSTATTAVVTLIVLAEAGAQANAYVYLSWTMAYTLQLLSTNVGMALVAGAAREPARLATMSREALGHMLRVVVPLSLLLAAGAPIVLRLFGADYAISANRLLQLFALSAIPFAVVVTYLSAARVRRRMRSVVVVAALQAGGIIAGSALLLRAFGIAGVGLAWLVTETALAAVLLCTELRTLWLPALHSSRIAPITRRARSAARERANRVRVNDAFAAVDHAGLRALGWEPDDVVAAGPDLTVVGVHHDSGHRAILACANDPSVNSRVRRRVSALHAIRLRAPSCWPGVVPQPISHGISQERLWALETRCAGVDARRLLTDNERVDAIVDAVIDRMQELYTETGQRLSPGGASLTRLVDSKAAATALARPTHIHRAWEQTTLARVRALLWSELERTPLSTALVHGDLWLGNVLCEPDSNEVTGLVDWKSSLPGIPAIDAAFLLCSTRALRDGRELGGVVRDVLVGDTWPAADGARMARVLGAGELSVRATMLLAWLQHVGSNMLLHRSLRSNSVWLARNVHDVLEVV